MSHRATPQAAIKARRVSAEKNGVIYLTRRYSCGVFQAQAQPREQIQVKVGSVGCIVEQIKSLYYLHYLLCSAV